MNLNKQIKLGAVLSVFLCIGFLQAQQVSTSSTKKEKETPPIMQAETKENPDKPSIDNEPYVPSEEISEDKPVNFPIDI